VKNFHGVLSRRILGEGLLIRLRFEIGRIEHYDPKPRLPGEQLQAVDL
jgi:hypothetical protein